MANLDDEASKLRSLARRGGVRFLYRRHAEEELRKDGIPKIDIENMLRRCRVSMLEERGGELTRRAEGTDINGRNPRSPAEWRRREGEAD